MHICRDIIVNTTINAARRNLESFVDFYSSMLSMKLFMIAKAVVLAYVLYVATVVVLDGDAMIWKKVVSMVVGISACWLIFQRDTYLPFLGSAALPSTIIGNDRVPEGANTELSIALNVADGTKMIYWGAEPSTSVVGNPWDAYQKYTNVGIATVQKGSVTIKFKCPAEYKVMGAKTLKRHIHYRLCCTKESLLGPVETVYVKCG